MLKPEPCFNIQASTPSTHPIQDFFVALVPILITVFAAVWTAYTYLRNERVAREKDQLQRDENERKALHEEQRANTAALLEARRPLINKQQEIYLKLLNATAALGNLQAGDPAWEKAHRTFWLLYWGVIPLLADPGVGLAMDRFAEALDTPESNNGIPLRNASMDLARACRESLSITSIELLAVRSKTGLVNGLNFSVSRE